MERRAMGEVVEGSGICFKRTAYKRNGGFVVNISSRLCELCGLSGVKVIDVEIIANGRGVIIRPSDGEGEPFSVQEGGK